MAINLTDNNPRIEYTVAQGVTESTAKASSLIESYPRSLYPKALSL